MTTLNPNPNNLSKKTLKYLKDIWKKSNKLINKIKLWQTK